MAWIDMHGCYHRGQPPDRVAINANDLGVVSSHASCLTVADHDAARAQRAAAYAAQRREQLAQWWAATRGCVTFRRDAK